MSNIVIHITEQPFFFICTKLLMTLLDFFLNFPFTDLSQIFPRVDSRCPFFRLRCERGGKCCRRSVEYHRRRRLAYSHAPDRSAWTTRGGGDDSYLSLPEHSPRPTNTNHSIVSRNIAARDPWSRTRRVYVFRGGNNTLSSPRRSPIRDQATCSKQCYIFLIDISNVYKITAIDFVRFYSMIQ